MKKYILLFATTVLLFAGCKKENKFTIEGTIDNGAGKMMYIEELTPDGPHFLDSIPLDKKGKFSYSGKYEYQTFYKEVIPEHKIAVIDAGMLCDGTFENRPFEIEGAVKFGFMGEILPEEGIVELIDAFNLLYSQNYQNELHIYGETHENAQFVNRLKQRVKNTNVFFHGPIQPGRMNAALNTFDALIIPAHWHRGDTFLCS